MLESSMAMLGITGSTAAMLAVTGFLFLPIVNDRWDDPVGISESTPVPDRAFDFIVVGAGAAGPAIAARLSEDPHVSVLLLEAGGDGNLLSTLPVGIPFLFDTYDTPLPLPLGENPIDWGYKTHPDPHGRYCAGMFDGQCKWHRGRAVGGTTNINGLFYVRGHPADFDYWAQLGNYGWSYEDVLPFFKKSEDNRIKGLDKGFHGRGGPMPVELISTRTPSANLFVEACKHVGFSYVRDYNGANQFGVTFQHQNSKDGKRFSTARGYLKPVHQRRPNLTILLNAVVERVIITKGRARGVRFQRPGKLGITQHHNIYANKEVIMSAGSIATPQILMLSGIGPKYHLQDMGIPVKANLPVGYSMQSHTGPFEPSFIVPDRSLTFDPLSLLRPSLWRDYLKSGTGLLALPPSYEGMAFGKTGYNNESWPDYQIYFLSSHLGLDATVVYAQVQNINLEQRLRWRRSYLKPGYTIATDVLHPKSRGRISLNSRDINDQPKIEPNYFSHPDDVRTAVAGAQLALRIGLAPPFKKRGAKVFNTPSPRCKHLRLFSDAYWACIIRYVQFNTYHDVGTCRMGPPSDPLAVVDPELRVYHVAGLRVADTSIMPEITSGNTAAPTMMIGEKCADMIKRTYGLGEYRSYG